jgi:hypothetical protein
LGAQWALYARERTQSDDRSSERRETYWGADKSAGDELCRRSAAANEAVPFQLLVEQSHLAPQHLALAVLQLEAFGGTIQPLLQGDVAIGLRAQALL